MSSLALRLIGIITAFGVVAASFVSSGGVPATGGYPAAAGMISGIVAIAGSLCLAAAVDRTLLRSGGVAAFKSAYLAAMGLAGLGMAEALSALRPVNIGNALLAYCVISATSGVLWVRFHARAA